MKKLLIISTVLLSLNTQASTNSFCERVASLTSSIMEARQNGLGLVDAVKLAKGDEMIKMFILDAYDTPRMHSETSKTRAVTEFSNKGYALCLRSKAKG